MNKGLLVLQRNRTKRMHIQEIYSKELVHVTMKASPKICRVNCKLETQESQWFISSLYLKA